MVKSPNPLYSGWYRLYDNVLKDLINYLFHYITPKLNQAQNQSLKSLNSELRSIIPCTEPLCPV